MWTVDGEYGFRARLADPVTGVATGWSPEATVKVKRCHAQVLERGIGGAVSVIGEPFVWRVHDTIGHTHVVADRSPFHLFRSPPLADGESFSYTFKGSGELLDPRRVHGIP